MKFNDTAKLYEALTSVETLHSQKQKPALATFPDARQLVLGFSTSAPADTLQLELGRFIRSNRDQTPRMPTLTEVLEIMFDAWCLHENSYTPHPTDSTKNGAYQIDLHTACVTSAATHLGLDSISRYEARIVGSLVYFFNHWSNDIQSTAAHMGFGLARDANERLIRVTVPAAPSADHYWHGGEWKADLGDEVADVAAEE